MNILIVEDEDLASERLQNLLRQYDPSVRIMDSIDTISGTLSYLRNNFSSVDLIFLDIQLADGKSFEIFQEFDVLIPVIFTTAYDAYAMEAFDLNSIDYLMKPVSEASLKKAMDKYIKINRHHSAPAVTRELATQLIQNKSFKQRFVVSSGQRMLFKEVAQIGYFFAQDKSCFLVESEESKKFLVEYTLEQLETLLDPSRFFRINRSVIINLDHIREVRSHLGKRLKVIPKLTSKDDLTISRTRVPAFKEWLDG